MTADPSVFRGGPFRPVFADRQGSVVLRPTWLARMRDLTMALQPIVSIHSARCIGYEALLRGHEELGFDSVAKVLDAADAEDTLPEVEAALYEKAMQAFVALPGGTDLKLFLNIDSRTLIQAERLRPHLAAIAKRLGVPPLALVFDVSERHPVLTSDEGLCGLKSLRDLAGKVSIDDFGTGYSGLPLLYFTQPDYVKIDRFFIAGSHRDSRKKVFLRQLVNIAHLLGLQVIAEGVESDAEYYLCRDVGCDLVQGFHIQRPLLPPYHGAGDGTAVARMNAADRRSRGRSDHHLVEAQIQRIPAIRYNAALSSIFERFRQEHTSTFFPVVNENDEPMGLVREQDLKAYAYSPYGKDLLSNKGYGRQTSDFVWRCPIADISTKAEKILEIFSADENSEGILMIEGGRYVGFLSARSLLHILNEKNLALARDQNPLTKLPGNTMINEYLASALADMESGYLIAYIDFDNFKPFNDGYGFRQGDRAITLFADILNKDLPRDGVFIGHVGGDDFFAAFRDFPFTEAESLVAHAIERFRQEVESFYSEHDRDRGCLLAKDREGVERCFPLLSASAAIVHIPRGHAPGSLDEIARIIAKIKKEAKASPTRMAAASLLPRGELSPTA
jgi:diguanylate cyclase (GGDEF)-like protein